MRYWRITTDPNDLDVSLTTQRDVTYVTQSVSVSRISVFLVHHLHLQHHQQQHYYIINEFTSLPPTQR